MTHRFRLFAACAALTALSFSLPCSAQNSLSVAPPEDDDSVESEWKSFRALDGYAVNLFASESMGVPCPVTMRWDEQGRLWVLSVTSYPQLVPGVVPNDKLVVLEDLDGDGHADSSHVFADGLSMPTGFELGYGGVFLGQGSQLLHLRDADGDGRADQQSVVLSGFGTADAHQLINSFTWSPGGELYFCQGHHIYSRVETPWGIEQLDKAGVWRLRPRRRQLAGFFNLSMAGENQWGVSFGHWGEVFHKSNGAELYYSSPGLVKTAHPRPLPEIGRVTPKGIIAEIVRSPHLPAELQGDFLIAGYMAGRIDRLRAAEAGSGYQAEVLPPFLESDSRSFRPIDIKIGPDGAIYVCDWYNPIIGHYQASMRHPQRDKGHGRIWRISVPDRPPSRPPPLRDRSARELLSLLETREHWVRYQVRRLLAAKPSNEVEEALDAWVTRLQSKPDSLADSAAEPVIDHRIRATDFRFDVPHADDLEHHLLEALWVYASHEIVRPELLDRLLASPRPGARAYATSLIARWHDRLSDPHSLLSERIRDEHPRVRMEAVVACSSIPKSESVEIALRALDQPRDDFIEHALVQSIHALQAAWQPAVQTQQLLHARPEHLAYLLRTAATSQEAPIIRRLLNSERLEGKTRRDLAIILARVGDASDLEYLFEEAMTDATLLSEFAETSRLRNIRPAHIPVARLETLVTSGAVGFRSAAIRLAAAWKVDSLVPAISSVAFDRRLQLTIRVDAIQALAAIGGQQSLPLLERLGTQDESAALRRALVEAVSRIDVQKAADQAAAMLAGIEDPEQASELLLPILKRRGGASALAASFVASELSADAARIAYRSLNAVGIDDPALVAAIRNSLGMAASAEQPYTPELVRQIVSGAEEHGSAKRGERVFRSQIANCTSCHNPEQAAGRRSRFSKAPDLSAVGAGLSAELIVESIIWPSRQVKEGFMATAIVTDEGQVFEGYEMNQERGGILRFRDFSANRVVEISLESIDERRERGSIMPRGYGTLFSPEELQDLVRYLIEQR